MVAGRRGRQCEILTRRRHHGSLAFMTHASKKLLEQFEALPDAERSEVVAELARRIALSPHEAPADDDLVAAADRLFTELDRREPS
jgi:hypothetical protein